MSGWSTVLRVTGCCLLVMALAFAPCLLLDILNNQPEWHVFGLIFLVNILMGGSMVLAVAGRPAVIEVRSVLAAVAVSALAMILMASLPFAFGAPKCQPADAVFEGVARLTASGGSIFAAGADLPIGLVLWRGLLQWLGGAWALVLGIAVLPYLRVGGMGFFRSDAFATLEPTFRARRQVAALAGLYAGLTLLLASLLWMAGLPGLQSLVHAMALISNGGATGWNQSLAHSNRPLIQIVAMLGMVLAGMPFPVLLAAMRGHGRALLDTQVRWYLAIILSVIALSDWWGMWHLGWSLSTAVQDNGLAVISAATGNSYTAQPVLGQVGLPVVLLMFLTTWGGCAGSTTGGLKTFRVRALLFEVWMQMGALLRPHTIRTAKVDNRVLDRTTRRQIMGYMFIYTVSCAVLTWALGALGLDELSAVSSAISAMANADFNMGHGGGYAALPDAAKVLLAAGMVLGRLEILPVLVLFTPSFWRR